jgi:hypothetical protein
MDLPLDFQTVCIGHRPTPKKRKKENLNVENFGILWGWGKFGI